MRIVILVVGGSLLLASCRHAGLTDPAADVGDEALSKGAWTQAIAGYDRALSSAPPQADRAAILYRRAVALLAGGGADSLVSARDTLRQLTNEYPNSLWSAQGLALRTHLDAIDAAVRALELIQEQRKALTAQVALVEEQHRTCEAQLVDVDRDRQQRDERLAELEDTVSEQRATLKGLKTAVDRLHKQLDALKRIDLGAPPP